MTHIGLCGGGVDHYRAKWQVDNNKISATTPRCYD